LWPARSPLPVETSAKSPRYRSNSGFVANVAKHALKIARTRDDDRLDRRIVIDGAVTLQGTVPDQSQTDRAAEVAKSVEGVTSVKNALTVRAPGG
jgi:hyperosmotically inducible periplasmic protein